MTETQHEPSPPPTDFEPQRLRTVMQMKRSRDDRMIAGVCGGLARYLNVDPVVVRVITAALTVVGGVGFVLYIAAWLLVPEQGSAHSIVGARTGAKGDERKLRTIGLAIAAVLAILVVADAGPGWGWSFPWGLAAVAFVVWLILRRSERRTPSAPDDAPRVTAVEGATGATSVPPSPRRARPSRGDGTLSWLTICAGLIAAGVLWLVDRGAGGVEWPDYVALELAVVGLAILIGTWRGAGRRLIPFGIVLALVLLSSTQMPTLSTGEVRATPLSAADVSSRYELGAGSLRVDLTEVDDLAELDDRRISIDVGMGETEVLIPDELDVTVEAHADMGDVKVFDREVAGWDSDLSWRDTDTDQPDLTIEINHSLGEVRVMHP